MIAHAFDVTDPNSGHTHAVYECEVCGALVQYENVDRHDAWHKATSARTPVYGWFGE